ncbi:MAG: hypothetical protein I3273_05625 [Candidatus Moeniiplasma glomeromycotorum]|nr:hypothetical protein [Candidatus Moeniiplasma glomeromycotorum]MCE8168048.1 hypothetical protein [Candidatus Moeniiplasma glomeromycotorum]MCE8169565.1 hypothetical protein [Candidatus Moeniiplasma glomeromycotorum]
MVIQTNEQEFKGKTLQEYLEWKYPTKEDKKGVKEIDSWELKYPAEEDKKEAREKEKEGEDLGFGLFWSVIDERKRAGADKILEGRELDLREFVNLERVKFGLFKTYSFAKIPPITKLNLSGLANLTILDCSYSKLTSLDLSGCSSLTEFSCCESVLTSIDFLNQLPNPEKLEKLVIYDNNIEPTTLEFLRPFVNLRDCKMGENVNKFNSFDLEHRIRHKTYNKFYGSLEPIRNLTKLEKFCIAGTDIDEGLEYLPTSLVLKNKDRLSELTRERYKELIEIKKNEKEIRECCWSSFHEGKKGKEMNREINELLEKTFLKFKEELERKGIKREELTEIDEQEFYLGEKKIEFEVFQSEDYKKLQELSDKLNEFDKKLQTLRSDERTFGEQKFSDVLSYNNYEEWLADRSFQWLVLENLIDCQPLRSDAKVAKIQNELRPFNYDIEAWQLTHPEKMLIARPELFTSPDSKDKWLTALKNKLEETKKELSETEREKIPRIARLEAKISELETAKSTISQQTQTEFSTQNKSTQTDLTMEQIEKWEQADKKKTLYQKFVEKYGKK